MKISSSRDLADFGSMEVLPSLTTLRAPFLAPAGIMTMRWPNQHLVSLIKAATKQTIKSGRHLVGRQKDPEKPRVAQEAYLQRSQWVNYFWHAGHLHIEGMVRRDLTEYMITLLDVGLVEIN